MWLLCDLDFEQNDNLSLIVLLFTGYVESYFAMICFTHVVCSNLCVYLIDDLKQMCRRYLKVVSIDGGVKNVKTNSA